MRRRHLANPGSGIEHVNVVPLIDVVMVLIIFFLLVGRLATERGAPVKLPDSKVGVTEDVTTVMMISVAAAAPGSGGGPALGRRQRPRPGRGRRRP